MKPLWNLAPVLVALLLAYASPCVAGDNTVGGTAAGADISTGTDNTLLGTQAGQDITSGGSNVIIGEGGNISTGSSNILIGNSLTETVAGTSTQFDLGDTIYGDLEATSGGTALNIGMDSDTGVTLSVLGEGSMIIPSGTTAQRPSSTTDGQIRYNSDIGALENYANGAWGTIPSTSSSTGGVFSSGQLLYDSATEIQYCPYKGNLKTTANYGIYTIPSGCLTGTLTSMYIGGTAGRSAAASTLYYVYLINVSGTTYLDLETTTHATDSTTGIEIESGNNTRTLVGMIYTDASSYIYQGGASNTVATWDNRQQTVCTNSFSSDQTTTTYSTPGSELDTTNRCGFMSWGDAFVFTSEQWVSNNTINGGSITNIYLDSGTGTLVTSGDFTQYGANLVNWAVPAATYAPAEGYHYTKMYGQVRVNGETGTWYANHPQEVITMQ
jgi:hypothetical protein